MEHLGRLLPRLAEQVQTNLPAKYLPLWRSITQSRTPSSSSSLAQDLSAASLLMPSDLEVVSLLCRLRSFLKQSLVETHRLALTGLMLRQQEETAGTSEREEERKREEAGGSRQHPPSSTFVQRLLLRLHLEESCRGDSSGGGSGGGNPHGSPEAIKVLSHLLLERSTCTCPCRLVREDGCVQMSRCFECAREGEGAGAAPVLRRDTLLCVSSSRHTTREQQFLSRVCFPQASSPPSLSLVGRSAAGNALSDE